MLAGERGPAAPPRHALPLTGTHPASPRLCRLLPHIHTNMELVGLISAGVKVSEMAYDLFKRQNANRNSGRDALARVADAVRPRSCCPLSTPFSRSPCCLVE